MKPLTITPKLTGQIRQFVLRNWSAANAEFVPVRPVPDALPNECFFNTKDQVAAYGGKLVFGWTIWLWPKIYIEAEHHCVWETKDGELLDVTPKVDQEDQILFVRDVDAPFDWTGKTMRPNKRRALSSHKDVRRFIALADEKFRCFVNNSKLEGRQRLVIPTSEMTIIENEMRDLTPRLRLLSKR